MKLCGIITGLLVLHLGLPVNLAGEVATGPFGPSTCPSGENLGLSPAQERALAEIERSFKGRLKELRGRLLAQRLEFKAALANPQAGEDTIRTKAEEVRRLWSRCQQTYTEYVLKIRAVLTPEQRRLWFGGSRPGWPGTLEGGP